MGCIYLNCGPFNYPHDIVRCSVYYATSVIVAIIVKWCTFVYICTAIWFYDYYLCHEINVYENV